MARLSVFLVRAVVIGVLIFGLMSPKQGLAGNTKILYVECLVNLTDKVATDLDTTLPANGLVFQAKAVPTGGGGCAPNPLAGDLFNVTFRGGINSFATNFSAGVGPNLNVVFTSIRNQAGLASPQQTTLTNNGNPILTRGVGIDLTVAGDPTINVTNEGSSTVTLTSIDARINNSQDPLDISNNFVPDGQTVAVSPSLTSGNNSLSPGMTGTFSFDIGAAFNWSFQLNYIEGGNSLVDLIATDVAEPSSLGLVVPALVAIGCIFRRPSASRSRPAH